MIIRNILPVLILLIIGRASAQDTDTFPVEGIYTNIQEFRTGSPNVPKEKLIRNSYSGNEMSIRQWINNEKFLYADASGVTIHFNPNEFWGYYENGTLYIFVGGKFHKVTLLGSISYFLESYPKVTGIHSPVVTDARATSVYRMLDMETGDIFDYDITSLGELLSRDEELSLEYNSISSMKLKRKKMYSFMERYNKKFPLKKQF